MSGGGSPERTTQTMEPPSYLMPYLRQAADAAAFNFDNNPSSYFPGSTVVPFSPQTRQSLGLLQNFQPSAAVNDTLNRQIQLGTAGTPTLSAAENSLMGLFRQRGGVGSEIDNVIEGVARDVTESVNDSVGSAFSRAGRFGSGQQTRVASREAADKVGNFSSQLRFQDLQDVRRNQLQGVALTPQLQNTRMAGLLSASGAAMEQDELRRRRIEDLGRVGGTLEGQMGLELQDQIDRYNFQQNALTNDIARFTGLLSGSTTSGAGSVTGTARQGSNPLLSGLSVAGSGLGIASQLGLLGGGAAAAGGVAGLGGLAGAGLAGTAGGLGGAAGAGLLGAAGGGMGATAGLGLLGPLGLLAGGGLLAAGAF